MQRELNYLTSGSDHWAFRGSDSFRSNNSPIFSGELLDQTHVETSKSTIGKAQQAEAVTEATSLLSRVESLMQESEKIAAAAKREKNWPAATSALREARGCLELLGKLRGELQQPGGLHLHKHAHLHAALQPKNEAEVERAIAMHVAEATNNFDPLEITRLKALVEVADMQSSAPIRCLRKWLILKNTFKRSHDEISFAAGGGLIG